MSLISLLSRACDIEQFVIGGRNELNQPIGAWEILENDIPCRRMSAGGRETTQNQKTAVSTDVFFIGGESAITERMRISFDGRYFEVIHVDRVDDHSSVHHLEVFAKLVV